MRTIRVGLVLVKFQMPCPIPDSLNQDPQKAVDLKTPGSHQPVWPWSSGGSFARIKATFRRKGDTPRSAQQQRQGGAWLPHRHPRNCLPYSDPAEEVPLPASPSPEAASQETREGRPSSSGCPTRPTPCSPALGSAVWWVFPPNPPPPLGESSQTTGMTACWKQREQVLLLSQQLPLLWEKPGASALLPSGTCPEQGKRVNLRRVCAARLERWGWECQGARTSARCRGAVT